jgi:CopG family nickel-responsive transcriptional regulator
MGQIERVGVSLEKEVLGAFDKLISAKGYQSRSEAIRDLIRQQLSTERVRNEKAEAVAAVVLVYDHHATALMERLTELQHSHLLKTISSLHVHLGHHDCLEVIVLRGKVGEDRKSVV